MKARTIHACDQSAVRGLYADLLPADGFKAWRLGSVAYPVEATGQTFDEALNAALPRCHHKDVLAILYGHDGKREKVLRLYLIKQQSKPVYRRNPETLLTEAVRPLYAVQLMETKVHGFDPVEPWRWTPGADVVGIDRTLIGGAE